MAENENDDTSMFGTTPDHDKADEPSGAGGRGTARGIGARIKQAANAVTGRDLDTASPEETERVRGAGPGGTDGD